jgi:hypothetical protein
MDRMLTTLLIAAAAACVTVLAPMPAAADSMDEALEVDRGASPDVKAEDTYRADLEKAQKRLKDRLAQCDAMQSGDRAECVRRAQELHDADVARAGDVLNRPAEGSPR